MEKQEGYGEHTLLEEMWSHIGRRSLSLNSPISGSREEEKKYFSPLQGKSGPSFVSPSFVSRILASFDKMWLLCLTISN